MGFFHALDQEPSLKSVSYLADSADAHVQGLGVTASPVQHFGRQLHHETGALRSAFEGAGVLWVIGDRQPLVVLTLVSHIRVS